MTNLYKLLTSTLKILPKYRRYIPVGWTLVLGIGLSVIACFIVYNWEKKSMEADLKAQLDRIAANIQRDVNANLEVVRAVGALHSGVEELTEKEFQRVFHSSVYLQPSFQAIAWLPRIRTSQRLAYEEMAKTQVNPNYQILEKTDQGEIIRAKERAEYFPMKYVFPKFVNDNILGFDFACTPRERAILETLKVTAVNEITRRL